MTNLGGDNKFCTGIPLEDQQESTLQVINMTKNPLSIILDGPNGNQWRYVDTPHSEDESFLCLPNNGCQNPVIFLAHKMSCMTLKIPDNGTWRIRPVSNCSNFYKGLECQVGGNDAPMRGTYSGAYVSQDKPWVPNLIPAAGWNKPWPDGGGYTKCKPFGNNNLGYCDINKPTSGATIIEMTKDGTVDLSMVDGYNFGAKVELTAGGDGGWPMGDPTTVQFNPQHCNYGIRNYPAQEKIGLGMLGCSNSVKDGNMDQKFGTSMWEKIGGKSYPASNYIMSPGIPGYCNMADKTHPLPEAWKENCLAPTHKWCDYIHSGGSLPARLANPEKNLYHPYCISHDDYLSSPQFRAPYKIKITFYDGIVGQPFEEKGCNWSFPDICEQTDPNCPRPPLPAYPLGIPCQVNPPPPPPPPPAPGPHPLPGLWKPCSGQAGSVCCNPNIFPVQNCPGGIACQSCGDGNNACQCP